jgi:hypothetical protein
MDINDTVILAQIKLRHDAFSYLTDSQRKERWSLMLNHANHELQEKVEALKINYSSYWVVETTDGNFYFSFYSYKNNGHIYLNHYKVDANMSVSWLGVIEYSLVQLNKTLSVFNFQIINA